VKILFDEGAPKQLRRLLARDDITLVEEKGWKGIKNGRLLHLEEEDGFDVLITADQNLKYQQNLKARRIGVIVLPYNRRKWMPPLVPALANALNQIHVGVYVEIPLPPELK
jgi:hypothetical protein